MARGIETGIRNVSERIITRRELFSLAGRAVLAAIGLNFASVTAIPESEQQQPLLDHVCYLPLVMNDYVPIKGLCYSPYRDGQNPDWGPYPTKDNIRADIDILEEIVGDIRTYGTDHNLKKIPELILEKDADIKVNAGCWLGTDTGVNDILIADLIAEANQYANVVSVTVGNETQQFGIMPEGQLINYINQVKQQIRPDVTITTGETWWAWTQHPNLVGAVDYIFAHIFPYWESVSIENAIPFIVEKYNLLRSLYPNKKVVIGETGWPSAGESQGGAVPSLENQERFITEFLTWAVANNIDFYLFETFDEAWKTRYEGEVGKHWGFYNSDRTPKHPGFSLK